MPALEPRVRAALRCPACRGELEDAEGALRCAACGRAYGVDEDVPRLVSSSGDGQESYDFYNEEDTARYGRDELDAAFRDPIEEFIAATPEDALLVELGSGRGMFSGSHPGYVGVDYSWFALARYGEGQRLQASAEELPFADESIDALFTLATLEHVPDPARAMAEIDRCTKPGGRLLLYPAWYVRPWAAKALAIRSYGELPLADRLRKASIVVRDRRPYRLLRVLPGRVTRELQLAAGRQPRFSYRKLDPNLEEFLISDSDAFSSMDPHAAAAYFVSRGYDDLRRPGPAQRMRYGYEPVVLRKRGG